jgi:hypothetical protein
MATVPHNRHTPDRIHKAGRFALFVGEEILGSMCLLTGLMLTITLFLLPVGIPLALLGVALMVSATESD